MLNNVKWLGHAAFQVTTKKGTKVMVDPWISQNPCCPVEIEELEQPDILLITHDHGDHLGDSQQLAEKAVIISQPELAAALQEEWKMPSDNFMAMNTGGTVEVMGVRITMVQAFHTSKLGSPVGFILTLEDQTTIYHAGDTSLFSSMELFGSLYPIDLALLPVGGFYTMDPVQAARAVKLLQPKAVIPMHYKTFPVLIEDPAPFFELVKRESPAVKVHLLSPGEDVQL